MLLDFLICGSRLFHSYSQGEKGVFKKTCFTEVREYFLSFVKSIWCLVRGLVEKDIKVTGW